MADARRASSDARRARRGDEARVLFFNEWSEMAQALGGAIAAAGAAFMAGYGGAIVVGGGPPDHDWDRVFYNHRLGIASHLIAEMVVDELNRDPFNCYLDEIVKKLSKKLPGAAAMRTLADGKTWTGAAALLHAKSIDPPPGKERYGIFKAFNTARLGAFWEARYDSSGPDLPGRVFTPPAKVWVAWKSMCNKARVLLQLMILGPSMMARFQPGSMFVDIMRQNNYNLEPALIDDADVMMEAVAIHGMLLEYASGSALSEEVVKAAVRRRGRALRFAPVGMQGEASIVKLAVAQNGLALAHASEAMRDRRGIVMEAVAEDGTALKHASPRMKRDRIVVMAAVRADGGALEYASPAMQMDPGVVMAAVKSYGSALEYATGSALTDEVVEAAVRSDGRALEFAPDDMRDKASIVELAVAQNGVSLVHASEAMRRNRGIVMAAVKSNPRMGLKHASPIMKDDVEVVMAAVKSNGRALRYASERMKGEIDVVVAAVRENDSAMMYAPVHVRAKARAIAFASPSDSESESDDDLPAVPRRAVVGAVSDSDDDLHLSDTDDDDQ